MNITLTNFRTQMFKLMPQVDRGETITFTHKKRQYVILPKEKALKLSLIESLNNLPKIHISKNKIKDAIEKGRQ